MCANAFQPYRLSLIIHQLGSLDLERRQLCRMNRRTIQRQHKDDDQQPPQITPLFLTVFHNIPILSYPLKIPKTVLKYNIDYAIQRRLP